MHERIRIGLRRIAVNHKLTNSYLVNTLEVVHGVVLCQAGFQDWSNSRIHGQPRDPSVIHVRGHNESSLQ